MTDQLALPAEQSGAAVLGHSTNVTSSGRRIAVPTGPLESVRITLKRTQCRGICPSYSVVLNGLGTASFDGEAFVLVPGHHTSAIQKSDVECLLSMFRKARFWSLRDKYAADITDGSTSTLTLTIGGKTKTVVDYYGPEAGLPSIVPAIEDEIDHLAAHRWIKGDADTLPSLRAEHFDFHSPEAATILANAAGGAPTELVEDLIEAGASATGRGSTPFKMIPGSTAIANASFAGRLGIVQRLIAAAALSAASPKERDQALLGAAASGNPLVVSETLKFHPNVDATNSQGDTPLIEIWVNRSLRQTAFKGDVLGVARELIDAGANPNIANRDGSTALFRANDAGVVRLLLKAGANPNVRNRFESTPLLSARSDDVALTLIEAGADVTAQDRVGNTIAKEATIRKYTKTMQVLQERAAKKNE